MTPILVDNLGGNRFAGMHSARPRRAYDILGLIVSLAVCFAAAGIGGWLTSRSLETWYPTLVKPSWNPPDWVFGPVWTALYAMMAVAAWLVWRRRAGSWPLLLFGMQLALNVVWSGLFFACQSPGAAAVEVWVLWGAIIATLIAFWRFSRVAGALLVPYLLWVSFAAVLNFALWKLNR